MDDIREFLAFSISSSQRLKDVKRIKILTIGDVYLKGYAFYFVQIRISCNSQIKMFQKNIIRIEFKEKNETFSFLYL